MKLRGQSKLLCPFTLSLYSDPVPQPHPALTPAQPRECIADNSLQPWLNVITSNFVDGGASEDGFGGYQLCSSASGPNAELDAHRLLVQAASGEFDLEVTLDSLTSGGSGGLAVTLPGLDLVSAARLLIWVEADHPDSNSGLLYSSLRLQKDGTTKPPPAPQLHQYGRCCAPDRLAWQHRPCAGRPA